METNEILVKKYTEEISKLENEVKKCEKFILDKEKLKRKYQKDMENFKKYCSKKIKLLVILGIVGLSLTAADMASAIYSNMLNSFNLGVDIFSYGIFGVTTFVAPVIFRKFCNNEVRKYSENIFVKELEISNLEEEKMEKEREITFNVIDRNKLNKVQYEYVDSPTMVNTINDIPDEPLVRTRKL